MIARILAVAVCLCVCVCLSVCVSVTRRCCVKSAKRRIPQKMLRDSPQTLVFWCHQWLVGDAPFPLKFTLKLTPLFRTHRFRLISAHSAPTVRAGEKSSVSNSSNSTSHGWTVDVTFKSPKGWLETRIFTFGVAFHIFVAGNLIHFKFGVLVEHNKSKSTDGKPSLKLAWSCHVTYFFNF